MVRRLILATAVSLCVTSNCVADAVRKLPVVIPVEATKQERKKQPQDRLEDLGVN